MEYMWCLDITRIMNEEMQRRIELNKDAISA